MPLFLLIIFAITLQAAPNADASKERASELSRYLKTEKDRYSKREISRKKILDELNFINSKQNNIRKKKEALSVSEQELEMAIENTTHEIKNHTELIEFEKRRINTLLNILYRIRRDGVLPFLFAKKGIRNFVLQSRALYRSLKSVSVYAESLVQRKEKLLATQKKLSETREQSKLVFSQIQSEEKNLDGLLKKKQAMLKQISAQQQFYVESQKEYQKIMNKVGQMISQYEDTHQSPVISKPKQGFGLPLQYGKITKRFGKSVHEKFGTVVYQKGVEFEAAHGAPVLAVADGQIEYEGWLQGLGEVVILHHGGGLYTLNGHLHKSAQAKGSQVKGGDVIGYVGDTGNSTSASLYFEIREKTEAVDPLRYLPADALKNMPDQAPAQNTVS